MSNRQTGVYPLIFWSIVDMQAAQGICYPPQGGSCADKKTSADTKYHGQWSHGGIPAAFLVNRGYIRINSKPGRGKRSHVPQTAPKEF